MKCPKCGNDMHNLGNLDGTIRLTYPAQWIDTHVCHACKVRIGVAVRGKLAEAVSLAGYERLSATN